MKELSGVQWPLWAQNAVEWLVACQLTSCAPPPKKGKMLVLSASGASDLKGYKPSSASCVGQQLLFHPVAPKDPPQAVLASGALLAKLANR